jgi:septal ring factor EnvC (AmiA/AmiB activator)
VYTNEDLERVHPLRHETGVSSVPAVAPSEAATAPEPTGRSRRRGEEYWRREARRVRDRVRTLAGQAATLRAQLAEREEERRRFAYRRRGSSASGSDATLRARLETTEHRMRELEDELQERARREGALPGWLR